MWVILENDEMHCYDSPFKNQLIYVVDCSKIKNIEEKVFNKLACGIPMNGIGISTADGPELYWAWGDDVMSIRGLWNRAFKKHHHIR